MPRSALIILVVSIVLLVTSVGVLYRQVEKHKAEYAVLLADDHATRERYGMAIDEIAAIQDSLNAIIVGDDGAQALEMELDAEKSLSRTGGDRALARIQLIKDSVARAKDRIYDLETRLEASGLKVAGLEKMVANLRASVAEREAMIGQLTTRVDKLQTQVAGLTAEVQQSKETIRAQESAIQAHVATIEDKRREMATVYYAIGSKDELKKAGLIVAQGGLLGLGKTLKASGRIDPASFTPIDTDQETVIVIPDDEARVISDQPVSSYELQAGGEQVTELRILDPEAFRSVDHVIIMTG